MATLYKYLTQGGREVTYLDADNVYKPEDIRQHWAGSFPELSQATTDIKNETQTIEHEGQQVEVDKVVTFAKRVGTKGLHPVIAALLATPPAAVEALALAEQLLGSTPDVASLIVMGPQLEQAVSDLDHLSGSSKAVVERCLQLKAQPSPSVPTGF